MGRAKGNGKGLVVKRSKHRKGEVLAHREVVYDYSLDRLLAGTISPDYVRERWQKLKEVKRKPKR